MACLSAEAATTNAPAAFKWTDARYASYDHKTFAQIPAARAQIDLKAVNYPLLNAAVFYETNRRRLENGKPALQHSAALEKAAFGHSRDMVKKNFFSHTSPVRGKRTMSDRMRMFGITNGWRAENIATGFGIAYEPGRAVYSPAQNGGYFSYKYKGDPIPPHTYLSYAEQVVNQWMNSSGHRANILSSRYTHLGCGAYLYHDPNFYDIPGFKATQNFADNG